MNLPFLFANDDPIVPVVSERWWYGFGGSVIYALLGITILLLAIKIFDMISPKIDLQSELTEKKNTAVAIVVAAIIIGVSYIVGIAIH